MESTNPTPDRGGAHRETFRVAIGSVPSGEVTFTSSGNVPDAAAPSP